MVIHETGQIVCEGLIFPSIRLLVGCTQIWIPHITLLEGLFAVRTRP